MRQSRILSWCERCGFKTTHERAHDRDDVVSTESAGSPWRCTRCKTVREMSAYAASLCERVD